jgi:thiol-disulfide isomerase/thioredoxin
MADVAANKFAAAKGAVGTFWTSYKKPIMIGVGIVVVLTLLYNLFGGRQHEPFYGQCGQYGRGQQMKYPGHEGFYSPMMEGDPEGFHGGHGAQGPMQGPMQGQGSMQGQVQGQAGKPGSIKKLILFYAPWCGHCKKLMEGENSPWQMFTRKHGNRKDLSIDQVDCDEKPDVATQFGIGGFPTIMLFNGDKTYTYDGDRSMESLERFLESPSN